MEIQSFFIQKEEFQDQILRFIDNPSISDYEYDKVTKMIDKFDIQNNIDELREICILLSNIADNHHHSPLFFQKIERIVLYLQSNLKSYFTNYELFQFFQDSKLMLLIFLTNQIIEIDKMIFNTIIEYYSDCYFFYPELSLFYDDERLKEIEISLIEEDPNILTNFNEKRQKGENGTFLCSLIQKDSIKEFVTFLNMSGMPITSEIKESLFETNSILLGSHSLIEYAAFYGANKILIYLISKGLKIDEKVWQFAIHSNNLKTIYLLENFDKKIDKELLEEAIKCYHNSIADYIINSNGIENSVILQNCFKCHNFLFSFKEDEMIDIFRFSCQYNLLTIVKFLLKEKKVDVNEKILTKKILILLKFEKGELFE